MTFSMNETGSIRQEPISKATFDNLCALIYESTGIRMRDGKQILVANRLRKNLARLGLDTFEQYYELLRSPSTRGEEMANFVDAVSTNETYFFREDRHFAALTSRVLPELFRSHRQIRIWCAGCSTGEEAYTLRIETDRAAREASAPSPMILGTDISSKVIAAAKEGIFHARSVRLVPPDILAEYFEPAQSGAYRIKTDARRRTEFRVHNLFSTPAPLQNVDVIFCRNVMIYFDRPTQRKLIDEVFAEAIRPGGFLFVGHSENVTGLSARFRHDPSFYAPIYRAAPEGTP